MSGLTTEQVKKIADLARMSISDIEAEGAATHVSGILENFEAIRSIDTEGIPPADDISGLQNVMREDIAENNKLADPKELLQRAKTKNGYIEVSAVFADQTVS